MKIRDGYSVLGTIGFWVEKLGLSWMSQELILGMCAKSFQSCLTLCDPRPFLGQEDPREGNGNPLQFSSVLSLSCVWLFVIPWTVAHHASLSINNSLSLLKSWPSSWWCHATISSSVVPFSSCLQSFPASGHFPMSQLFASGGQSTGASASASVLPMNIQDWFPSFRMDWLDLLAVHGILKYSSQGNTPVFFLIN